MKDYNKPLSTFISVKSRIENLYLAGQSINLHGVMGVTFTSLLVCSEILGNEVVEKIGL
jgi:all-trans-retinol 13,14-reductase